MGTGWYSSIREGRDPKNNPRFEQVSVELTKLFHPIVSAQCNGPCNRAESLPRLAPSLSVLL